MPALDNAKRERFATEFLIDRIATQAAIRAGYSARTAYSQGQRLLKDVEVAARIAELEAARAARVEFTSDEVLAELKLVGKSDVTHYVLDDDGHVTLAEGAPEGAMRAVSSIKRRVRTLSKRDGETERTVDVELKLWSKPDALRMGGQHNGMFGPKGTADDPVHYAFLTPPTEGERARREAELRRIEGRE